MLSLKILIGSGGMTSILVFLYEAVYPADHDFIFLSTFLRIQR